MELLVKFGNARIVFNADQQDLAGEIDEDSFGGGNASVCVRDWLRVYNRQGFNTYGVDIHEMNATYRENRDARVLLSNDDFIVWLDAISREPKRKYTISWNGLSYWLCHDIVHAKNDVYGGAIDINDSAEERTLYEGAIMARSYGTSLSQIVRELTRAETAFRERFNCPTQALDRFLHEIETTV